MKKRTKWTVAGAIALAIVIIGVTSAMKGRNKATEVRMEKVQRRDLVASVTASGQVQPHTKGQNRGNPATQSHGPTPHDGMAAGPPIEAHNARHVRDDVAMTPIGKVL